MKTQFIVNVRSGRAARVLPAVRRYAAKRGAAVVLTERPGHGRDLAREALASGFELVVAVGGDGTMNEIATALIDSSASLGLVPCGSGDGLGRHLGIHGSPDHAFAILDQGNTRLIDTGLADGHSFFTAAGIGFEAVVADRFNRLARRGFVRYLTTSLGAYRSWRSEHYVISHSGGREEVRAFTLTVANANQYGNNARIAPAARIDDGKLDLVAVPPVTIFNGVPLGLRLFRGGISTAPGVRSLNGERFKVDRERSGLLHTDGEIHPAGASVEFKIRPASLRIVAPARAESPQTSSV